MKMKILSVTKDISSGGRTVQLHSAMVLMEYGEGSRPILSVDGAIHQPDSRFLRPRETEQADVWNSFDSEPRCVGVVEGGDEAINALWDTGYSLADLRQASLAQFLEEVFGTPKRQGDNEQALRDRIRQLEEVVSRSTPNHALQPTVAERAGAAERPNR